jgi:tetratricopeptide (TPR) repeat protein
VLGEGEARAVVRICQLVGGLPLAIELAAAALRVRSCTAIAAAIETSLSALTTGLRGVPERHRSIWATFEHSWRLLSDEERQVFPRLAVFRGGFEDHAAASVAQASPQLLAALADKSLLRWDGVARYDLHELVRQYASEKVEQAAEAEAIRKQHAIYYLELAETTEPHLHGPDQVARLDRLEVENDNLRAALRWFIEGGDVEGGLRLGGALWWFWWERGYLSEGRSWLDKALATVDSGSEPPNQFNTVIRARALNGAGVLASEQSDYQRAQRLLNESLALFRELEDKHGTAIALRYLGRVMLYSGDYERAIVLLQESLVLFRELGEKQSIAALLNHLGLVALYQGRHEEVVFFCQESLTLFRDLADKQGIAVALHNLGWAALSQGDYERGTRFCEESLALLRELKHTQGIAALLIDLGYAALYQNELERASALCLESLALYQQIGNKEGIVFCLEGLAGIAATSQPVRAARLFAIAHALRSTIFAPLPPLYRAGYDRYLAATRAQLDEATFAAAWGAGRAMTLEQAVAEALADDRAQPSSS